MPKHPRKFRHAVLAYDLGGTKIAAGVVTDRGEILEELREAVELDFGPKGLMRQLERIGKYFLKRYPLVKAVGIASAGPLDPMKGVLLDPTNMTSDRSKGWGRVSISYPLARKLGVPTTLENDAAASILAEHWLGGARRTQNAVVLTLGTGLGTGILCNGALVRAGRHLHPEGGHLILRQGDVTAPCGCGNLGCAEAYLSGRSFTRRFRARTNGGAIPARTRTVGSGRGKFKLATRSASSLAQSPGGSGRSLPSAAGIAELARRGNRAALFAFQEYSELLATAIHNYVVLYAPTHVILTGSFAEAEDLFLPRTRLLLRELLRRRRVGEDLLPKLLISPLSNRAGLLGGAYVALFGQDSKLTRKKLKSVCFRERSKAEIT